MDNLNLDYKIFTNQFDEIVKAENLENESSGDNLKRPDRWGGYLLIPDKVEFWKDETNRLHKRELFTLVSGTWKKILLSP